MSGLGWLRGELVIEQRNNITSFFDVVIHYMLASTPSEDK
jgi:hypothetical protein